METDLEKDTAPVNNAAPSDSINPADRKVPLALKIIAVISLLLAVGTLVVFGWLVYLFVGLVQSGWQLNEHIDSSAQAVVLNVVALIIIVLMAAQFVVFSIRLLRNKRRGAGKQATIMGVFAFAAVVVSLMLEGVGFAFYANTVIFIFLVAMSSYLDPALAEERRLQRRLQQLEDKADAEDGTLGRDKTGKGYLELNFFNMFWIFLVACFLGWCFEMIICPFLNGRIEDRTGMLIGPFSPIYGFGALFMTIALNRFYKANPIIVFVISAIIGAGFEFLVSYFFQYAFGIMSWDYSNEPFNLQGRTDLFHAVCWGVLGLGFVRWVMPALLKLINKIPWNWRYGVTVVFAAFMIVNGACTLISFDCWYQRMCGRTPDTPVAQFFAEHCDNDFMQKRFPTMSIDPNRAAHD